MRLVIAAVVVAGATSPVFAQPTPCEVTIARAPDQVRAVIEAWVQAEPRCTTSLELRVIPTDGGLYLFARDTDGRIHERIVPDAQSAGVLVASWIADDRLSISPAPPAGSPVPVRSPAATPAPFAVAPEVGTPAPALAPPAPTLAPVAGAPGGMLRAVARPAESEGRWLTLGVLPATAGTGGSLRGEIELLGLGHVAFGLAVTGSWAGDSSTDTVDVRAVATAAYTGRRGPWSLRLQTGFGIMYLTGWLDGVRSYEDNVPVGELSAMLGRELRSGWALGVGPMMVYYVPVRSLAMDGVRFGDVTAFLGLSKRL